MCQSTKYPSVTQNVSKEKANLLHWGVSKNTSSFSFQFRRLWTADSCFLHSDSVWPTFGLGWETGHELQGRGHGAVRCPWSSDVMSLNREEMAMGQGGGDHGETRCPWSSAKAGAAPWACRKEKTPASNGFLQIKELQLPFFPCNGPWG